MPNNVLASFQDAPMDVYDTPLNPIQERAFQQWRATLPPKLRWTGDYDLRGAFLDQLEPSANAHLSDKFKKPNHPTFSDQSIYAAVAPQNAGSWDESTYRPGINMLANALRTYK